ncbi:4Fe-4S binding protein, partial [Brucella melitensis]|nr:4Fe-4S binding protein [Brucella melitensis]
MGQLGLLLFLAMLAVAPARAADIGKYLPSLDPQVLFQGADSIGEPQGEPPIAPVKKGNELLGYAYLNSDFTNATGYSGKPIR